MFRWSYAVMSVWVSLAMWQPPYPSVTPLHVSETYRPKGKDFDTPFRVLLTDRDGITRYRFECHNDSFEDLTELAYSGTFQCALFALDEDKRTSWNLLADKSSVEQSSDWYNRGRMLAVQLHGSCGSAPEYGSERHFHLRGMVLTMRFTELAWDRTEADQDVLRQFTFVLDVQPDASATTSESQTVSAPRPSHSCGW